MCSHAADVPDVSFALRLKLSMNYRIIRTSLRRAVTKCLRFLREGVKMHMNSTDAEKLIPVWLHI